jgi:outer membrane biosynthesis protein TonB
VAADRVPKLLAASPEVPEPAAEGRSLARPGAVGASAEAASADGPGSAPTAPASSVLVEDGVDGDALRQFRIAVARHIGPNDFPELAGEIGSGNASVVRVVVGPEAGMAAVTVARSSGRTRLDAKAREVIGAGVRSTPLPPALRGREFVTEFRVEFRPRDGTGPR